MSDQIPAGAIVITSEMMYQTLTDVVKKVDHIETLLNPVLNDIRKDVKENKAETDKAIVDHETRIRAVEKLTWKVVGASSVVSALLSLLIVWLGKK